MKFTQAVVSLILHKPSRSASTYSVLPSSGLFAATIGSADMQRSWRKGSFLQWVPKPRLRHVKREQKCNWILCPLQKMPRQRSSLPLSILAQLFRETRSHIANRDIKHQRRATVPIRTKSATLGNKTTGGIATSIPEKYCHLLSNHIAHSKHYPGDSKPA